MPQPSQSPLKSASTDENGDWDGVLIAILVATSQIMVITAWDYFVRGHGFDAQAFGTGIAAILGAGGTGYAMKRWGEKKNGSSVDVPQS